MATKHSFWRRSMFAVLLTAGLWLAPSRSAVSAGAAAPAAPAAAGERTSWTNIAREVMIPGGKTADWLPSGMRSLYTVVDDAAAEGGKALQVRLDKSLALTNVIPILRISLPSVPTGVYKVTARLKLNGMIGVIGNAIRFTSRPQPDRYEEATLHGYQFDAEGAWQEFSYLTEVVEPDIVTHRPLRNRGSRAIWSGTSDELKKALAGEPAPAADALQKQEAAARQAWKGGALTVEMGFLPTKLVTAAPLPSSQIFGRIRDTIQSLGVDRVTIQRMPEPAPIVVRQVLPAKIRVIPGNPQVFHVWLHNRSGSSQTADLTVRVVHGLSEEIRVASMPVTLKDGEYRVLDVPWVPEKGKDLWGCSVFADIGRAGKTLSSAEDVFSVQVNPWAVHNFGGGNRSQNPYYDFPSYVNHVEFFGITYGDVIQPFPDDPSLPYPSGMGGYYTHIALQKKAVDDNREAGITTMLYIAPVATGLAVEKNYLKHPEWFNSRLDWTDQANDLWLNHIREIQENFASNRPPPKFYQPYHIEAMLNLYYDAAFNQLLDGILKNLKEIGYDGIRWDGTISAARKNALGEVLGTDEEMVSLTVKRFRQLKELIRKQFPSYTKASNGISYMPSFTNRKVPIPPLEKHPTVKAFLEDGSGLMDEGWMSAYHFRDPRNIIEDYYWVCRREVDYVRQAGGFLHTFSPERDTNPYFTQSTIYYNLLVMLAGSQYPGRFSCTPGSETGSAHFATRFSEFLFDSGLKWMAEGGKQVRVDADHDLWYDDYVSWRDLPNGRRRYVIPLVNPPTVERFYRNDRFGELPAPVRKPFHMEAKMPQGFSRAHAWMLTAEPRTAVSPLETRVAGGVASWNVPELIIYRVVVVEFEK